MENAALGVQPDAEWACPSSTCATSKSADWCRGCPREKGTLRIPYHFVSTPIPVNTDLLIIAEAPINSRNSNISSVHNAYADDSGTIVNRSVESLRKQHPELDQLTVAKTYAVLCTSNQGDPEPSKKVLDRCSQFLLSSLNDLAKQPKKPILLLMGKTAIKALGIKVSKLKDVQSRLMPNVKIGENTFDVVITISTKQLVAVPGLYETFLTDLRRALTAAIAGVVPTAIPIEQLTKDYVFPKTVEEVRILCEEIEKYTEGTVDPENWAISVDSETNTKFPHRDTLKIVAISFAWGTGKSTAIPLWHTETPYDPALVVPFIQRLLASRKPKQFHNAKFDLKVFMKLGWTVVNFAWDSMTGEHVLEEEKKGNYGLKPLTRTFFPEFAAYADVIQELLAKDEGDSQLDNIRRKRKKDSTAEAELLGQVEDDAPKKKKRKSKKIEIEKDKGFAGIPLAQLLLYAAIDTDMTRRISIGQARRITAEQNRIIEKLKIENQRVRQFPLPRLCKQPKPVWHLAVNDVFPVTPTIARMELQGIRIDRPYLAQLQNDLGTVVSNTERELYAMAGHDVMLNSPTAIVDILFKTGYTDPATGDHRIHLNTDHVGKTKKGQLQTTEKVMQYLVAKYECVFAAKKLIYAKAAKAKNTFCQNVWDLSELDGYLHTNYNQHGTKTGRLSSNDENMQNVPKKLAGVNIKKIFITSDASMLFVNADAKGAEVRILTAYCKDEALIASLNAGQDTHCFIASKIVELVRKEAGAKEVLASMRLDDAYPLTYDDFSNRESFKTSDKVYGEMLERFRTAVKRVVFGILYGAGPQKIAETIGISLQQAKDLIDTLFRMFPSIQTYMAQTRWELRTFGYVETYFGRRRRFNVIGAPKYILAGAERQTVNFKIQSTSSDIVLGRLHAIEDPLTRDLGGRLLLTVHDSIGFEIPKKYAHQLPDFIHSHLEEGAAKECPWLPVDFKWDYEVGPSYGELKPLDAYLANAKIKEFTSDAAEAYTEEEVRTKLAEE